ncbi:MAG: major capsid protein [Nitrospira sp.]|nr:MAG: major capsid protein [Nitrospira sp.]
MTDELLEDVAALATYINRKAPRKIDFKVNLAIIQGNGAGQPLGILSSPALVSVAKETSQAADTIVAANIMKMYSRMYAPSRQNAVWLINQDIEPQLFSMQFAVKNVAGTENVGGVPVYLPANGLSMSPYATLFGRPVIPTQAMETLGDKGDILFADLSQYMSATKAGGIRQDVSIHLWFDYDVTAFRFVMRIAGQPWWATTVAARDGSTTYSPFVTLDERA